MSEFEKNRMEQAVRRRKTRLALTIAAVVLVAAAIVIGGFLFSRSRQNAIGAQVSSYDDVGREHIALGASLPKPYNSNPPSSGAHFSSSANWGIYDYEVHDQIFMHNLEHGGIWIAYKPDMPDGAVNELKQIVNEFGGSKLVMAPRLANDADIALVAWRKVMKFDLVGGVLNEQQKNDIRAFYKSFKNKGPEFVPDGMLGIDPKSVQK